MQKRIGKVTAYSVMACAVLFIFCWFVVPAVFARPTVSDATNKLGGYTGSSGAGAAANVKADLDIVDAIVDAILVDTAAVDTAAELQVLIAGGYRCTSVALTSLTTADDLWQVTGGPIIIRDIIAIVQDGGLESATCKLNYNIDPIAPGTDTPFATDADALEINGDAAGTVYIWDGVIAADLTYTTNGVVLTQGHDQAAGLLCPIGMIETIATASNTGDITFYLIYSPLSPLSVVTPQ